MIPAIVIGRGDSKGFPGKNAYCINGHPLMSYPIRASNSCMLVDETFFSTDSEELKNIAIWYGAMIIGRPAELATDEALGEDVFVHAYNSNWSKKYFPVEMVVLMFANAPCITSNMIGEMITELRNNKGADSICTISKDNSHSPYRANITIGEKLIRFLPEKMMAGINCDRSSGVDCWYLDYSCAVVRPRCLEDLSYGIQPRRWLGKDILYYNKYRDIPCYDVDYEWQVPQIKDWINKYWNGGTGNVYQNT